MRTIIAEEGVLALWTGFFPALAVYCPFVGIYFMTYEETKRKFHKFFYSNRSIDDMPLHTQLIGGAVAGGIAAAVTSPLDVIKTRIQVGSEYSSWRDAVTKIWAEEGPRAFAKGIGARVLWIAPATAITIAAYEQYKKFF
jgi:hypothetical protein